MPLQLNLSRLRTLLLVIFIGAISLLGDPIINVEPSTSNQLLGDNFTVDVVASGLTDLYAFQFDLGFDPTIVAVNNVTEGPFLGTGGSTLFIPGTIDNIGGSVSNNADTLLTAISGVTGSGTLATFNLTAIGPGDTSLSAFNVILLDSSLSEISATVQNGSVNVPGVVTPEPLHVGLLMGGGLLLLICVRRRAGGRHLLWILPSIGLGQSFDTTPPTLLGFDFSPMSIDVTSGRQTFVVTWHVTDNLSGVLSGEAYVQATFLSPSGKQSRLGRGTSLPGSTPLNATFQATFTIPQYSESGNWTVSQVVLSDAVGNTATLTTSDLESMFFPTVLTVADLTPDTTPPTLTSLSVVPSSINVSSGPQFVTLSLGLTDTQSGTSFLCGFYCYYGVEFTGPSGDQFLGEANYNFALSSGTADAGVWTATINFPQYAQAGLWTITALTFHDNVYNYLSLSTAQLQSLGFSTTVNVTSTPSDSTPPVLTGLTISPLAVDTSTGPATITLTLGLTDNLSGVDFAAGYVSPNFNNSEIYFTSPSGQQTAVLSPYINPFTLNAGTPLNGQWQYSFVLPQFSEGGTWTLQYFQLQDTALNELTLSTSQLKTEGFPTTFIVYKPSLTPDGTVTSSGGTIQDTVFGSRASLTFPPGEVSSSTTVAIDVLSSPLSVPTPAGFSVNAATFFTNIQLVPEPSFPLPAPGLTLVLPLVTPMSAGMVLDLYRLDPTSGLPIPAQNTSGANIHGFVDASGLSATFMGISRLSTAVAYLPLPGTVLGDVNEDGKVNCADIAIVKADFGKKVGQTGYNSRADVNQDGVINILDLAIVARQLPPGMTCP
jgi:hypothetical protein